MARLEDQARQEEEKALQRVLWALVLLGPRVG